MNLSTKCKKIKIVLTDVDGVLTDGGMYYTKDGDIMKKFHTRDGMGITLLKKQNISTIIITKEKTMMVKQWSKKMKIRELYDGVKQKDLMIEKICKKYELKVDELAYIGDDVNDIELLKKVGLSACPADGIKEVKDICDYVCKTNSGNGAFRELSDLILSNK